MVIEAILFFCAVTSLACATLLARGYRRSRTRLLLWSSASFGLLAINCLYLFVDLIILPNIDLGGLFWRSLLHAASATVLLGGLILELA